MRRKVISPFRRPKMFETQTNSLTHRARKFLDWNFWIIKQEFMRNTGFVYNFLAGKLKLEI